ncbi:hypothetical protein SKAU_G00151960 [Synaphobranchus kaupii]|uniref:Uncharacterized protein n=1 Tax=Synaphobranchus kaupii TaxID=118154 RepID=A0A9Q1FGY0_SYNKA|nr:hypothetical protein SKAU_G00151960 [Synaphobranchus kaupii]
MELGQLQLRGHLVALLFVFVLLVAVLFFAVNSITENVLKSPSLPANTGGLNSGCKVFIQSIQETMVVQQHWNALPGEQGLRDVRELLPLAVEHKLEDTQDSPSPG